MRQGVRSVSLSGMDLCAWTVAPLALAVGSWVSEGTRPPQQAPPRYFPCDDSGAQLQTPPYCSSSPRPCPPVTSGPFSPVRAGAVYAGQRLMGCAGVRRRSRRCRARCCTRCCTCPPLPGVSGTDTRAQEPWGRHAAFPLHIGRDPSRSSHSPAGEYVHSHPGVLSAAGPSWLAHMIGRATPPVLLQRISSLQGRHRSVAGGTHQPAN
jgi:hypothetical protein